MTVDDLRLADFRPRPMLRAPAHEVRRPRYPVVDAHNHLGPAFGGDWSTRPPSELIATLDESGVEMVVDLDGGQGEELTAEIDRWQAAYPDRVAVFAGLDYGSWADDEAFGESEAARLRDAAARGARRAGPAPGDLG